MALRGGNHHRPNGPPPGSRFANCESDKGLAVMKRLVTGPTKPLNFQWLGIVLVMCLSFPSVALATRLALEQTEQNRGGYHCVCCNFQLVTRFSPVSARSFVITKANPVSMALFQASVPFLHSLRHTASTYMAYSVGPRTVLTERRYGLKTLTIGTESGLARWGHAASFRHQNQLDYKRETSFVRT